MSRPRTQDSSTRAPRLLAFCSQPRTLQEILAHFDGDERWRFTVYNLVKRRSLRNINAHLGRTAAGLFVATEEAGDAEGKPLAFEAGMALQQAWGMRA
jgi:hypothetical protein